VTFTDGSGDVLAEHETPHGDGVPGSTEVQGRQDSNLQPPVLETGALPIAPRPSVAPGIVSAAYDPSPMPLAVLFSLITVAFAAIAVYSAASGVWPIAVASAGLAAWMGTLAVSALRKMRS
jgi:hypothetical protein